MSSLQFPFSGGAYGWVGGGYGICVGTQSDTFTTSRWRPYSNEPLTQHPVSLQSLCGCSVTVSTIDGNTCNMKITDVIKPGMRQIVAGQGLPLPKNPEQRGDLVVEFDVNFPETLPSNAKDVLKRHLPA